MKRIIISPEQLRAINEAAISFNVDNINQVGPMYKQNQAQIQQAANSGLDYATFKVNNGGNNQNGFAVDVEKDANGNINTDNLPSTNVSKVNVPIQQNESRYSKRQVELGRMLEMRRTGKVYSKKQLNEMFFESEDICSLVGRCNLSDIFSAADILVDGGEERLKEAYASGADLNMVLKELYDGADEESQEEFKDELGI